MDPRAKKSPFLSSNLKQHQSADEILKEIKNWMQSDGNESKKNYEDLVKHIELTIGRQFTCLETTWVERQYTTYTSMQYWIRGCKKHFIRHSTTWRIKRLISAQRCQPSCLSWIPSIPSMIFAVS